MPEVFSASVMMIFRKRQGKNSQFRLGNTKSENGFNNRQAARSDTLIDEFWISWGYVSEEKPSIHAQRKYSAFYRCF